MKLTELDARRILNGIAFLCPCCKREYLTVFFSPTPYDIQRQEMASIVNPDAASWVPYPSFESAAVNYENDFDRITIRPALDARAIGHARVEITRGDVFH